VRRARRPGQLAARARARPAHERALRTVWVNAPAGSVHHTLRWVQCEGSFRVCEPYNARPRPAPGMAFTIYFLLGFFGAARWGADTQGDLLENVWGPGPYQGTLNTLLGIYLAFTMPPICYPTAHVVKARAPGAPPPRAYSVKPSLTSASAHLPRHCQDRFTDLLMLRPSRWHGP